MQFFTHIAHVFDRVPMPHYLLPAAAGVDISDSSIKWISLARHTHGLRIASFGEVEIPAGAVERGMIKNPGVLIESLKVLAKSLGNVRCVHVALPEEEGYVFSMHVPLETPHEQILSMIEFEFDGRVPIQPAAAVYDYDVIEIRKDDGSMEIGVSVFPRDVAQSYADAFAHAGLTLLSLEIEARSIARSVVDDVSDGPITMVVDFGRARTGFSVLNRGVPIFTSTVEVGGDLVTKAVMDTLHVDEQGAGVFKDEEGLVSKSGTRSPQTEAVAAPASALADEIVRHYRYWDTRRDEKGERVTPVERIILVGGSSNLKGLPEYIAARVQAKVERGRVWRHLVSFDEYIPPIDERTSLEYATSLGLALRGVR